MIALLRFPGFVLCHIVLSSFLLLTVYLFKSLQLYIICAILITILWSIYKLRSIKLIFISSLILFLTLRLIFFVSTQFRILPFIDTYWDLAVVRTFLDNKEISILSDLKGGVSPLEGYSAWPFLHIFEYVFIITTDMNPLLAHILNTLYIPLIPFIFTFLIIRLLHIKLALPIEFVYIASIFYATMPDTIYWSLQLIRNTLAWAFISILIFLILKNDKKPSYHYILIMLLLFVAIILSHHWSSIMIIFGFSLYLFIIYVKKSNKEDQFNNYTNRRLYITYILFLIITLLIWWINYSNIIFEMVNFNRVISIQPTIERWTPTFPPELVPAPLILLLRIKMFLIYIPVIIGLYFIYRYYKSSPVPIVRFIFLFSTIIIVLAILNFVIDLEPTRVVILFIPFILISLSLFYTHLFNRNNSLKLLTTYIFLPFIIIISFIGIFSHSIIPSHLYDNNLDALTIGEHPTTIYINEFLQRINYSDIINIFSDDTEISTLLLPSSQLHKIEKLSPTVNYERFFTYNSNRLVVIMQDFFSYRYARGGLSYISYDDALLLREEIKRNINRANLLYADSYSFIYQ